MIKQLKLKNFQAHEDLTIDLDPGVTTIVGPSDVGKSAIMRSLKWVACNTPAGADFIRWGTKRCVVSIETDEGSISRTRSASINKYELDGREFVAFGKAVPEEVVAALGLEEMNFQGQYDGPFWLGDSAGEVSRQLNRVACLEIIDDSLAKAASLVKAATNEAAVCVLREAAAVEELERWKDVPKMQAAFEPIAEMRKQLDADSKDIEALEALVRKGSKHLRDSKVFGKIVKQGRGAIEVGEQYVADHAALAPLGVLIDALEKHEAVLLRQVPHMGLLEEMAREFKEAWDEYTFMLNDVQNAEEASRGMKMIRKDLAAAEEEFIASIGERCPICQTPIRS